MYPLSISYIVYHYLTKEHDPKEKEILKLLLRLNLGADFNGDAIVRLTKQETELKNAYNKIPNHFTPPILPLRKMFQAAFTTLTPAQEKHIATYERNHQ
jgi:hypothetical protein